MQSFSVAESDGNLFLSVTKIELGLIYCCIFLQKNTLLGYTCYQICRCVSSQFTIRNE